MKRFIIFVVLVSSLFAASCAREQREDDGPVAELTVKSVSACAQLKSVIRTTVLDDADAAAGIGLCLLSKSGTVYNGNASYANARACYVSGKWQLAPAIKLNASEGILYGYFPYDENLEDITAVPVEASIDGTDYLFAEPLAGMSNKNSSADIVMKHALSRITVKFIKDESYKGAGKVSEMTFSGEGLASSGTLNVLTGVVTAGKSTVSIGLDGTIAADGYTADCLVVPTSDDEVELPLEIVCTIDGTQLSVPLNKGVCICSGVQTVITVSLRAEGLSLVDVWVEPWAAVYGTSENIDGMHMVKIEMENDEVSKDVLFQGYSKGTDFIIEAYCMSGRALECSVPEDCTCLPSQDWETKMYTFTVSGFKRDITAVISYPHDEEILGQVKNIKVRNTAFYKKVFMDAGYMFDPGCSDGTTKNAPVALKELLLENDPGGDKWKYMEAVLKDTKTDDSDTLFIRQYFDGYSSKTEKVDLNGPLLYPDGEPRFSVYFCMGGNADEAYRHKACIGDENLWQLRTFFEHGGSFVASGGAGAVFLGSEYEGGKKSGYLSLYDGKTFWTHTTANTSKNIILEKGSPLLELGSAGTVNNVTNCYGVYLDETSVPAGTEILARYGSFSGTGYDNTGKAAVWAYKQADTTGRLVLCGSKPEKGTTDAIKSFFKSEFRYAMEGNGFAKVKGVLHNGETRMMNLKEGNPSYCAIGDGQCHHFVFNLKQDAPKLYASLDWETEAMLEIYLKRGSYAFPEASPEYSLAGPVSQDSGSSSSVLELNDVPAGLWFLTVRCASVPLAKRKSGTGPTSFDWSYYYTFDEKNSPAGSIAAVGGVPYSVSVMWTY